MESASTHSSGAHRYNLYPPRETRRLRPRSAAASFRPPNVLAYKARSSVHNAQVSGRSPRARREDGVASLSRRRARRAPDAEKKNRTAHPFRTAVLRPNDLSPHVSSGAGPRVGCTDLHDPRAPPADATSLREPTPYGTGVNVTHLDADELAIEHPRDCLALEALPLHDVTPV